MRVAVAIIGAGIAGAGAAFELSRTHDVLILEREDQPGYHTTGRSAALFTAAYGNDAIRALSRASRGFLDHPPSGFADHPLLSPRGVLMIAPRGAEALVETELAAAQVGLVERIDLGRAHALVPILDHDYVAQALYEPGAADIDVAALHQGFLKGARARGARLATGAELRGMTRHGGLWHLDTTAGDFSAAVVINAAGAWAEAIGAMAGAYPIGLVPKRRTAIVFDTPTGIDARAWPLVYELGERFYIKPDAGRLMGSPADETPSLPCDAQPEDLDVALAVDRIETATRLRVAHIIRKWAGLRSFVADKSPVIGPARDRPGLFWLAGQGGYGIQTVPAASRLIAAMVRGDDPATVAPGVDLTRLLPARLDA